MIVGTHLNAHGKKCCSSAKSTFFNHPVATRPGTSSAVSVPEIDQVMKMEHLSPPQQHFCRRQIDFANIKEVFFYFSLLPIELLKIHLETHQSTVALFSTHSSGLGQAKSQGGLESLYCLGSRQIKDQAEIEESTSIGIARNMSRCGCDQGAGPICPCWESRFHVCHSPKKW